MWYLAKVWDGSKGRVGDNLGYTLCMAIACENGCRKIVPLMLCTMRYEDSVMFKSHNKVHNVRVKYGSMPVRLPVRPDADLHLVVVKWPGGEKPMMLLTTLNAVRTRKPEEGKRYCAQHGGK